MTLFALFKWLLLLYRCCIFKTYSANIYLQSNWRTEATFRSKFSNPGYSVMLDIISCDCLILSFRLMLMLVVWMILHLLIPTNNYALSHAGMTRWLRYWLLEINLFPFTRKNGFLMVASCTTGLGCWSRTKTIYIWRPWSSCVFSVSSSQRKYPGKPPLWSWLLGVFHVVC